VGVGDGNENDVVDKEVAREVVYSVVVAGVGLVAGVGGTVTHEAGACSQSHAATVQLSKQLIAAAPYKSLSKQERRSPIISFSVNTYHDVTSGRAGTEPFKKL